MALRQPSTRTITAVLARRGLAAIDADDDPLLARSGDAVGNVVEEEPEAPDFARLARHSSAGNPPAWTH